jgi:molecular chaperone GrpE
MKNINLKKGDQKPIGDLKNRLDFALADVEELKNQLARALADYDNLRKRTEEQKFLLERIVIGQYVTRLLPILDMLNDAQKHLNDQGLAISINEFRKILNDSGVEEIQVKVGDDFKELYEEVVDTVEHKSQEYNNKIAEIVLPGWKFKDGGELEVLRPSKVKVYKISKKE